MAEVKGSKKEVKAPFNVQYEIRDGSKNPPLYNMLISPNDTIQFLMEWIQTAHIVNTKSVKGLMFCDSQQCNHIVSHEPEEVWTLTIRNSPLMSHPYLCI